MLNNEHNEQAWVADAAALLPVCRLLVGKQRGPEPKILLSCWIKSNNTITDYSAAHI